MILKFKCNANNLEQPEGDRESLRDKECETKRKSKFEG